MKLLKEIDNAFAIRLYIQNITSNDFIYITVLKSDSVFKMASVNVNVNQLNEKKKGDY